MGMQLPDWLREALSWAGVTWPEADESLIFELADAWSAFADNAEPVTEDALQAVETLLETNESDGLNAFRTYWQKVAGDGGYMFNAKTAATVMSVSATGAAIYVLALKITAIVQLVALAIIIIAAIAAALETLGASLAAAAEAAVAVNRAILAAVRTTIELIETLGRTLAEAVEQMFAKAIEHLRARPIHSSKDRVDDNQEPISDRLDNAAVAPKTKKRGSNFPLSGPPNGMLKTVDPQTGEVKGYAEYDANGDIVKRVDLTGAAHAGIPTPHTVYYNANTDPKGKVHRAPDDSSVRPAYPEEVP